MTVSPGKVLFRRAWAPLTAGWGAGVRGAPIHGGYMMNKKVSLSLLGLNEI